MLTVTLWVAAPKGGAADPPMTLAQQRDLYIAAQLAAPEVAEFAKGALVVGMDASDTLKRLTKEAAARFDLMTEPQRAKIVAGLADPGKTASSLPHLTGPFTGVDAMFMWMNMVFEEHKGAFTTAMQKHNAGVGGAFATAYRWSVFLDIAMDYFRDAETHQDAITSKFFQASLTDLEENYKEKTVEAIDLRKAADLRAEHPDLFTEKERADAEQFATAAEEAAQGLKNKLDLAKEAKLAWESQQAKLKDSPSGKGPVATAKKEQLHRIDEYFRGLGEKITAYSQKNQIGGNLGQRYFKEQPCDRKDVVKMCDALASLISDALKAGFKAPFLGDYGTHIRSLADSASAATRDDAFPWSLRDKRKAPWFEKYGIGVLAYFPDYY